MRLAVAAGVVTVLALATVSWAVFNRDEAPAVTQPTRGPSTGPTATPVAMRSVTFKGITISAPTEWKQSPQGSYLNVEEPTDTDRWLRLNAVTSEKNARNALQSAENNSLKKACDGGYQQIGLTEQELGGTKGAQLEFLCTPKGKAQRHGIWRIAVINGSARHLYLQTWESTYTKDKAVFDAALASFKVT